MARPTVDNDTLLAHARAVFLADGTRATTAQVAKQAGVSEALIFKRFGTKEALFIEAMRSEFASADVDWLIQLEGAAGSGDIPEHLVAAGIGAIAFFRQLMPMIMMSRASLSNDELARHHGRSDAPPFETRRRVEHWFENERRLGRVRNCDSEILARTYIGSLFSYASWDLTLGPHDPRPLGPEPYVRGMVDLLWRGIAPGVAHA